MEGDWERKKLSLTIESKVYLPCVLHLREQGTTTTQKNNAGTVVYPSLVWRFFIISKSVSRITSYTQTHIISFQVNSCSHKTKCVLWIKNGLRSPLSCLKCVWSHEINVIERQIFVKNHGWRKFDVLLWNFAIFTWFLPQKRTKFFNRGICKQHYLLSIRLI